MDLFFAVWAPTENTFWDSWINANIVDNNHVYTSEYPGISISSSTNQFWLPTKPTGSNDANGNPITQLVDGWHANIKVSGPLVQEFTYSLDQYHANGQLKNIFDRTWAVQIFQLTYRDADANTGFPAGYRNNTGVCYTDMLDFSSPTNIWAT